MLNKVILYLEVKESRSLYVYINISCLVISLEGLFPRGSIGYE